MSLKPKSTKLTQAIRFYFKSVLINSKKGHKLYRTRYTFLYSSMLFIFYFIPLMADPYACFAC